MIIDINDNMYVFGKSDDENSDLPQKMTLIPTLYTKNIIDVMLDFPLTLIMK